MLGAVTASTETASTVMHVAERSHNGRGVYEAKDHDAKVGHIGVHSKKPAVHGCANFGA